MVRSDRTWIGIDLGTQSVRAVAVDDVGALRAGGLAPAREPAHRRPRRVRPPRAGPGRLVPGRRRRARRGGRGGRSRLGRRPRRGRHLGHRRARRRRRHPADARRHVRRRPRERPRRAGPRGGRRGLGPAGLPRRRHAGRCPPCSRCATSSPAAGCATRPTSITAHLVGHDVPTDTSTALKTGYDVLDGRWPAAVLADLGLDVDALPAVVLPGQALGGVGARRRGGHRAAPRHARCSPA